MSEFVSSPGPAEDAFTRLWRRADDSHGQYVEAIAELRERKRRERETSQRGRWRRGGRGVSDRGMPARQRADGTVRERVPCERCARGVERVRAEWVATSSPGGEPVEHLLCPRCADEVGRALLRLLGGEEPVPPRYQAEREMPLTLLARAGSFVLRMGAYGLTALAVFAFFAWFSTR